MNVLIINFNRLTLPRKLAEWVSERGCTPIFIDNNSDYPPLLHYYNNCPFRVLRLKINYGHTVMWQIPILHELGIKERFILTDPDLDLSGVPDDFVEVMHRGLDLYTEKYNSTKCALSLEINDLPDTQEGNFVRSGVEPSYWKYPIDDLYFYADTDTTFAMYNYPIGPYSHQGLRTNRPYTAKHVPWYYTDFDSLPDDEKYYYQRANKSCSHLDRFKV